MRNRDIQQSSRHDLAPNPFKRQLHKMVKHTQTICGLLPMPTNYLSLFDHFVGLVIKGLITLFFFYKMSLSLFLLSHYKIEHYWNCRKVSKNKRENKITSKE